MLDDSLVRRMVLTAIPDIDPSRFEVCMMDYDATIGWWLRKDDGTKDHGRFIALNRTEKELAADIAADVSAKRCGTVIEEIGLQIAPKASPYEGKRGKHPNSCTCSKHLKAHIG